MTSAVTLPIINSETRTQENTESIIELALTVPENLLYLEGHFPHVKVLPGVTQVHWAAQLARGYFEMPEYFVGMEVIKFQHVILPNTLIKLQLRFNSVTNKLHFQYTSAHSQHSSGRMLFSADAITV
ncbi:MAG: hypothetical protein H0W44_00240 [Gammaproteobacteria bacterium]|nr:hypothetical protein [Gammaproteobacteria bacterium]